MGRVQDKVVLVTGGARGQGHSHAVKLAEAGADVIFFDMCHDIETNDCSSRSTGAALKF
jgi:NAD(P)-dependent dehydrogenase (short-subunit alcohol dehydrogenase family)